MHKTLKITCLATLGLLCILFIAAPLALYFVDINDYTARVEKLASTRLGMKITLGGQLTASFYPRLHITAENVQVHNQKETILTAKQADLGIHFVPLLYKKIQFSRITLQQPLISILRHEDGRFNYEQPKETRLTRPSFNLAEISIENGTLQYIDNLYDDKVEAKQCNGDIGQLQHPGGPEFLGQLSLTAAFICDEIETSEYKISELEFSLDAEDGNFKFDPVTMNLFGGQGAGNLQLQRAGPIPQSHVQFALSQFRIEDYFKTIREGGVANGLMDFSLELSMRGKTRHEQRRSADGRASLEGKNLTVVGRDLDEELKNFASSQNFSLVDLSAFFFAGPIGLAVTQGYEFSNILMESGGETDIRILVSKWKINDGVAQAEDVAFATDENRLALHGDLDFVQNEFKDVTIAVIDTKGCAKVRQKLRGPFLNPTADKPDILAAVVGPVVNLFSKAKSFFTSEDCEVFYTGSVAPVK